MKYHNEIMRVAPKFDALDYISTDPQDSFVRGSQKAIQAAAEIAAHADARISELEEAMRRILSSPCVINHMPVDEHEKYCSTLLDSPK